MRINAVHRGSLNGPKDGSKIRSFEVGQAISSSPAVAGDLVVVGCDDGYVYAFGPQR